ncbi:MAG TPA: DUF1643 domain-containing protein [Gemmatimonadaceae bacterium]
MTGNARIDGKYRYNLTRTWDEGLPRVCFVMLNPSTADASQDDPTIRRCIGYAQALGAGSLEVVNLYALRATDPRALAKDAAPIGPDNDKYIELAARSATTVVCAWGAHAHARGRGRQVLALLRRIGAQPMCLKQTKAGYPSHPLYLPAALRPVPLRGAA